MPDINHYISILTPEEKTTLACKINRLKQPENKVFAFFYKNILKT